MTFIDCCSIYTTFAKARGVGELVFLIFSDFFQMSLFVSLFPFLYMNFLKDDKRKPSTRPIGFSDSK